MPHMCTKFLFRTRDDWLYTFSRFEICFICLRSSVHCIMHHQQAFLYFYSRQHRQKVWYALGTHEYGWRAAHIRGRCALRTADHTTGL
jgi:hypothetical protein